MVWDVVIVGCGPIGAFAANALGKSGLRILVLDRDSAPYALPRAVHIDHEMVRLFSDIGLADQILEKARAGDGHIHIGADHGVIRFLSVAGAPRPFGYANDYFFYQPELEGVLRQGLERFDNVELRLGAEVLNVQQNDEIVTLSLADGTQVQSRWVIGCDGARSTVRRSLSIKLDDLDFNEPWLVVDAEVDGPISFPDFSLVPAGANLQNLSLMMCDPQRPATIVPGRGNHRRWEFMLLPGEDDAHMAEPSNVAELVAPWVSGASHKIIRAATYRFHGLVAEQWRKGRVFLAGDSAHQTPPFFGQGMCHGLRDAANLAWKLAGVSNGTLGAAVLDTYQIEREAQVRHVIHAAIDAGRYICELDASKAAERDLRIRGQKDIRSASELIAPIASPLFPHRPGERFINPQVAPEQKLDDVTGGGWVLLIDGLIELTPVAQDVLTAIGARTFDMDNLTDATGFVRGWLDQRDAVAVLVRPDFYVGIVANSAADLSRQIEAFGTHLVNRPSPVFA
ncbi:bifunctional 3-(3-hydroxy-phenyl)propionate/3-hydroxycinnamic acid hydroxylase [Devosia sp. LjRoot3]|uniref:bifunctional 3-(3-hydroxy-phenyl)propionate/3-hydroxycinnamic acid hydroxylase MhpA n=1 Tax=Devosia sp. LjRoot3 TaxID=3342319 RepID=UPI003ECF8870